MKGQIENSFYFINLAIISITMFPNKQKEFTAIKILYLQVFTYSLNRNQILIILFPKGTVNKTLRVLS